MDDYDEELLTICSMDDEDENKHTLFQEYFKRKELRENEVKFAEFLAKDSWHENELDKPKRTRGK
jgi:hypothetical protein